MTTIDGVLVEKGEANGLTLDLLGMTDDSLLDMGDIFDNTELQVLTQEDVAKAFEEFKRKLSDEQKDELPQMLKRLATFIYINGIHEDLKDDTRTEGNITWKQIKTFFDFKSSRKQTILRWVVPILYELNSIERTRPKNLSYRHAAKYGLEADLKKIGAEWRFFGSYFHPDIDNDNRAASRVFQKKVIVMAQGGAAANQTGTAKTV